MTIRPTEFLPLGNLHDYKIHFACHDRVNQPLDVFVRSRPEWQGWQEYWPGCDAFSRPFIFALMDFYPEPDTWLFGGIYRVTGRDRQAKTYMVELSETGRAYIGRLKLGLRFRQMNRRVNLEAHWPNFEVREILREPYTGRPFPGLTRIEISFSELETIVRLARPDWKTALQSTKGIYLISDTSSGKKYVGSAYGVGGLWSRWCDYAATGHGGNVELRSVAPDLAYCRSHFRFALLEPIAVLAPDPQVLARETFWKGALGTRHPAGLNLN